MHVLRHHSTAGPKLRHGEGGESFPCPRRVAIELTLRACSVENKWLGTIAQCVNFGTTIRPRTFITVPTVGYAALVSRRRCPRGARPPAFCLIPLQAKAWTWTTFIASNVGPA